jgi:hypothetical protein
MGNRCRLHARAFIPPPQQSRSLPDSYAASASCPRDLLGFFGPIVAGKKALPERGAHEEESIQRRADGRMVAILREADRTSVAEAAKKHKVSEQTIYAWRKHFSRWPLRDSRQRH